MSLVPSLLQAIVRVDGEALVMHAGDKPYVVASTGQVELANRGLTLEAVNGVLNQLLPVELQQALEEFGAVQYELPAMPEFPGEHFTVVAARGGDDLWTEIRRRRVPDDDRIPDEFFAGQAQEPVTQAVISQAAAAAQPQPPLHSQHSAPPLAAPPPVWHVTPLPPIAPPPMPVDSLDEQPLDLLDDDDLGLPNAAQLWPPRSDDDSDEEGEEIELDLDADIEEEEVEEEKPAPLPPWQPAAAPPAVEPTAPVAEMHMASGVVAPPPAAPPIVAPPLPIAEVHVTPPVVRPPPVAPRAVAPPAPIAEVHVTPPVATPPRITPPVVVSPVLFAEAQMRPPVAAPPPVAPHAPVAEMRETPAVAPHVAAPPALATELETTPAVAGPAAPSVVVTPAPVVEMRETSELAAPPPDAPDAVATPALAAKLQTTPAVAEPAVMATAAPQLDVPATAETAEAATPAVTEPTPAAPVQRIFRAMQRYSATASPPPDAPIPEMAAEAIPVLSEQLSAEQAAAVSDRPELEVTVPEVVAAAPPVVTEETPAPFAKVRPTPPVAAPPARITGALRLDASTSEAVPAPPRVVVDEAPAPIAEARPMPPADAPAAKIAGDLRLDAPTPKVASAAPGVVAEQSPTVEEPVTFAAPPLSAPAVPPVAPAFVTPLIAAVAAEPPIPERTGPPLQPAVVLPIWRAPVRAEQRPPVMSDPTLSGLERLLRVSAARGASALYLSSGSRPSVRVDGELQMLDGEPVHVSRDVESLLLTLMPERSHEALRSGSATEWIVDIEGVGRVRCMGFRDHLGPGGVFRLMPTRSMSADQLGLSRQVQSLAIEAEGLVLVAGPRSSGKRTLMSAFVDLMNRTRRDHIITIEREINIVHERGQSFISQREIRGNDDEMLAAARGALREDPDVLVIEDLRTGPLVNIALEAAASGRLVVGGFSAHTATGAIDRIIDFYAPEYRRQVQIALADSLRGVIVQALLRKIGGGRLPAREVLLNTPAVSNLIAEGKTSQLPMALEGGRRYGMMPLNDMLVGLVQNGSVEAREAYRRSPDRPGFLAALNRHGLDTSFVERLA